MNLKNLLKVLLTLGVLAFFASASAFAQNTVYVDATNGSNSYTGANETNSPAGSGPKATLTGATGAIAALANSANGGTIIIKAGNYAEALDFTTNLPANVTSYTIQLKQLNSNNDINFTGAVGATVINRAGLTVTITQTVGTEDIITSHTTINFTAGNINLSSTSAWVMADGTTINMAGTAGFTNAAPTKTNNVSLNYTGGSSFNAGPESNYGSYGTGTITVNKTAGTTVTFQSAVTTVAGITLTAGNATFSNTIKVSAGATDVVNNGAGTLTFNGALSLGITDGTADANLASLINTNSGSIVTAAVTWTTPTAVLGAANDFAGEYAISNTTNGSISTGAITLNPPANGTAARGYIFEANNGGTGTLSLGTVSASSSGSDNNYGQLRLTGAATAGTINIAGGVFKLITINTGHTLNVNGATTLSDAVAGLAAAGVLTNGGTINLVGNLTLSSATNPTNHLTNGGTITGAGKVVASPGAGVTYSFNGGNLGNIEVAADAAGIVTFGTNAFTANTMTLTSGTANLNIAGTTTNMNITGATVVVANTIVQTVTNFSETGGSFDLLGAGATQLDVKGNFNRTGGAFTESTGGLLTIVSFTGSGAQSVNGGPLFQVEALTFTNAGGTVTVGNSIRAKGTVTISTATNVDFGTTNLILNGTANGMINNGTYTATGGGGVIIGGANTVTGGVSGNGFSLQGTGTYSYITVDVGSTLGADLGPTGNTVASPTVITVGSTAGLATGDVFYFSGSASIPAGYYAITLINGTTFSIPVNAAANDGGAYTIKQINAAKITTTLTGVKWNGVLTLRSGALSVATAGVDFGPTGSTASIVRYPQDASGIEVITGASLNAANVAYDLTYTGALTADQPVGGELTTTPANVKSWTVQTTGAFKNNLPSNANVVFGGTLTITKGATVNLPTGAATDFELSGTGKTHSIKGTISFADGGDYLLVSGASVTINGGATTDNATIGNIQVSSATGCTIAGINSFSGTFTTNAGSVVSLGMNTTTATQRITGAVTLGGTSLTLTTNIEAQAGVTHNLGLLAFGGNNLQITTAGNFTGNGGTYSSTGGYLVLNFAGANFQVASAIPNVRVLKNVTVSGSSEVSGVLELGSTTTAAPGLVLGANNLTVSGSTVNFIGGTALGAITANDNGNPVGLTIAGHGLISGQYIYLTGNTDIPAGYYKVTSTGANTFTIPFDNTGGTAALNGTVTPAVSVVSDNDNTANGGDLIFTNTAATLTLNGFNAYAEEVTENATGGSLTIASNNNAAKTLTIWDGLTQTKGDINLGINVLSLTGNATAPLAYTQAAGNVFATTGWLEFKFGAASSFAQAGVNIDNLKISAAATNTAVTKQVTINKNLWLSGGAYDNGTGGTSLKLILADGVLITRDATAGGSLTRVPTFGANVDLKYTSAGTTGNEVPVATTTYLRNITVTSGAITLGADATAKGTVLLNGGSITDGGNVFTLASNAFLEYNGGTVAQAPAVTNYNLTYNSGFAGGGTGVEFVSGKVDSLTIKGTAAVQLSADESVKNFTLNSTGANSLDLNGKVLTLTGNMYYVAGTIVDIATGGSLTFGGTVAQTINVPTSGWTLPAGTNVTLNNAAGFTLANGNMSMGNNGVIFFINGVLTTNANTFTIVQTNTSAGFDRSGIVSPNISHINGKVSEAIVAGAGTPGTHANGRYEFPVGTSTEYRPFDITFTSSYPAINPTNVVVTAVDTTPGGTVNLPLDAGNGLKIGNYPAYYWLVKTTPSSFSSTQNFDLEMHGTNLHYPYVSDQNLRIIRRQDGNATSNGWAIQGVGANYSNYQVVSGANNEDTLIVARTTSTIGGIVNEGTRFTIGIPSRAPLFTLPTASKDTVAEHSTATVTFSATVQDAGTTITGYTKTSGPSWATLTNAGVLTLAPNYGDAVGSPYTVIVTATCSNGLSTPDTITVVVTATNRPPTVTARVGGTTGKTTILNDSTLTVNYVATDADAGQTLKWVLASVTPALAGTASITTAGVLTFPTAFADAGKTFVLVVGVSDIVGDTVWVSDTVVVNYKLRKGFVDGNAPNPNSASLILGYAVGDTSVHLTAAQLYAADVTGDGLVTAYDASWILYAYAHHDSLPNGTVLMKRAANGSFAFGQLNSDANSSIVTLPITISNSANIYSAYVELNIDNKYADIESVDGSLPQGWMMSHFYNNGVLKIAMAGLTPLRDGNLAIVTLKLKDKEAQFTVNGTAELNANLKAELSNFTVKQIPSQFELSQNYPNPFNPTTTIKYQLAQNTKVTLTIYDMLGQQIKTLVNGIQDSGYYTQIWDGSNDFGQKVSSGVYIYRLQAGSFVKTLKMNLLK